MISPAKMGATVEGFLNEHDLRRTPEYSALSYVWGDEPEIHPIVIDGQTFNIGLNLLHALQHLRDNVYRVPIWVNSLCINQKDGPEGNAQVRRMADIYQQAGRVYV